MINEMFKSVFRTLGRFFAYIILGFLAYIILTWFGLPYVKAESYISGNNMRTNAYLYSLPNLTYVTNSVNGGVSYPNGNSGQGGRLYTYTWSQNSQTTQAIPVGSYQVQISFIVHYRYESNINDSSQTPPIVLAYSGGNATCDGTSSGATSRIGASTSGYGYTAGVIYNCSKLDITQSTYLAFYYDSLVEMYGFNTISFQLINLNDIDENTQSIINNNTQNTNRIINQIDSLKNDVQASTDAIEAMEAQLHSDMERMIREAEAANQEMIDTFTDDSDADLGFMEEIADWMPIDTPVTDIITLPINILNKLINGFGGSCSPWTINTGSLLGNHTWTFPCLNIGQYLTNYSYKGYNLWQLIDLMICMYMGYEILMLIISAYNGFANLEDLFDSLYTPRHVGYKPKHGDGGRL